MCPMQGISKKAAIVGFDPLPLRMGGRVQEWIAGNLLRSPPHQESLPERHLSP
jgi:hypothetical protein